MKKLFGLLAVAGLMAIAAPAQQASASVLAPGAANAVQQAPESLATEVRWRRGGGWRRHYGWRPHRWHRRRWW